MTNLKRAIVLASGGLDSTTCLAVALDQGFEVYAMSFDYNQRHRVELKAAARVLDHYGIPAERRRVVALGRAITGSALTGDYAVPTGRDVAEMAAEIPVTYVPGRNIVFLAHACSWAEAVGASDVFIGVNALDYSGYPDCRPEFIEAFQAAVRLGTKAGVEGQALTIQTPLVRLSKADIVRLGTRLGAPFALTHSCYMGTEPSCGECDACLLRLKGFLEAGIEDPVAYAK